MDLLSLLGTMLKRWYVVLPVVGLTFLVAATVHASVAPQYQASGWVLLETPNLDQAMGDAANVDIIEIGDAFAESPPAELPAGARFVVRNGLSINQYELVAAADSAEDAEAAVAVVYAELASRIEEVQAQARVQDAARHVVRLITPSIVPTPQPDGTFTALAAVEVRDPFASIENPYGADGRTGRILAVAVNGDTGRATFFEQAGPEFGFVVSQENRDSAALLRVVTTGPVPSDVIDAFYTVRNILNDDLDARQARAGVPGPQRIRAEVFDPPLTVADVGPPINRATAAVLLLGGLLAVGSAIAANSLLVARRTGAFRYSGPGRYVSRHPQGHERSGGVDERVATDDDRPPVAVLSASQERGGWGTPQD